MKDRQDAFGRALLDTHLGKGCVAVIERDDGLVECDTLEQYFTGYGKWSPLARRAVRCATGHVLDIGAGAGRHSLYLQNKGLRVTAIDVSPHAVELCRMRGIKDVRLKGLEQLGPKDGRSIL